MILIETTVFTKQVQAALSTEEYRAFQLHLLAHPETGDVIPGSGPTPQGSLESIGSWKECPRTSDLYLQADRDRLFLLFLHAKNVRAGLTPRELRILRDLIRTD